jgi:nicotinate phosphoribosyltransferase
MAGALSTDLYELTMAAGYWRAGITGSATFELFVRRLPTNRSYLIVSGIEPAVRFLESFSFTAGEIAWLKGAPQFAAVPREFFDSYLASLRFSGDVWAIPEGTPVFANEPIVRVQAPIGEAQLVETALLAIVGFETSVASKASRMVTAARQRPVVEFGARRAHGLASAFDAARASFISGCAGTSFVEAGRRLGIPVFGTMAHSWVQAFATELDAFREFGRMFVDSAVYLLDTYDTVGAARRLAASGLRPPMVRLDSGDLPALSRHVRGILDEAGLSATKIFATGDLDEYRIAALVSAGAPIDGFGVGTALTTVDDAPALSTVYKLVEIERSGRPIGIVKLSPGKETLPGAKQVWRSTRNGTIARDRLAAVDESPPADGEPLMIEVMRGGRAVEGLDTSLARMRERCRDAVASLPEALRQLEGTAEYPVEVSDVLESRRDLCVQRQT